MVGNKQTRDTVFVSTCEFKLYYQFVTFLDASLKESTRLPFIGGAAHGRSSFLGALMNQFMKYARTIMPPVVKKYGDLSKVSTLARSIMLS